MFGAVGAKNGGAWPILIVLALGVVTFRGVRHFRRGGGPTWIRSPRNILLLAMVPVIGLGVVAAVANRKTQHNAPPVQFIDDDNFIDPSEGQIDAQTPLGKDVDCDDFATHANAQAYFDLHPLD